MNEEDVKVLADWYWNEYIFRVSYEINPTDYEHLLPDIATFGTDNVEVLLEVLSTVIWAKEHHHLTGCIPKPYIPMALYSTKPSFVTWNVPTKLKSNHNYHHKNRDLWVYLVCLPQFWRDNRGEFWIWHGPIRPMLANLVKRTANGVLLSGFGF